MSAGILRVRAARPADAPAIVALLAQLGYPGAEAFIARRIETLSAHPDEALRVGEVDARVVAAISIHFIPQLARAADFARISYLCVDEACRGQGIGQAMEAHGEALARRRGCDRIELHSHARRADAHRFYARLGYVESPKYLMKDL